MGFIPDVFNDVMAPVPPARHLLKAKDFADANFADQIGVDEMAAAVGLSRAHFSRQFKRAFGESPNDYLLTRRLERAASLLRDTDYPVNEICLLVGLRSVGTFTAAFKRTYGKPPGSYRESMPPAARHVPIPPCLIRMNARPPKVSTK